jgi:hypothetical protein
MKTYKFYSEYLNNEIIKIIFSTNPNWKEAEETDKYIDFMYIDNYPIFKKQIRNKNAFIKTYFDENTSDMKKLTNKSFLYENMLFFDKDFTEKYFMPQYNLSKVNINSLQNIFKHNKLWILKPTFLTPKLGFKGQGIKIIKNFDEIKDYEKKELKYLKNFKQTQSQKYKYLEEETWILAEYIKNPLLFKNKKFHIRVYFILTFIDEKISAYVFNMFPIFTAKKEYMNKDFNNKNIHNTHMQKGKENINFFPSDFILEFGYKKTRKIFNDIFEICSKLFYYIKQNINVKCYFDSNNCYELYGIDLMITDNFEVKILELNEKPGIASLIEIPIFSFLFLEVLIDSTINKAFNNNYKFNIFDNLIRKFE